LADGLIQTGFDKLLGLLDADRETAGAKYESLRVRLVKYFEWRNCEMAEELADTVFDRVIKKLSEGEEIQNVNAYATTVAQFVFMEFSRSREHLAENIEDNPNIAIEETPEDEKNERRFVCLEKCLAEFSDENRKLIIAYYDTDEKTMIAARKRLSDAMDISLNTLRIRVCRLKSKLEDCTFDCCRNE
jgi:DNA-directed RNA polymerase specialized sigma24 family protein